MNSEKTESADLYDLLAWLEANKKQLIIGVTAVVVVGFVVAIYRWNRNEHEAAANAALLKVSGPATPRETPPPASAFLKVANDFQGTETAERALLLAATTSFTENRYSDAQDRFREFLSKYPSSPLAPSAAYGVATALEAENKKEEALAAYQNVLNQYATSAVADDAKLALARNYEAKGQIPMAFNIYEELSKPTAGGSTFSEASRLKEHLLRDHPELAKTTSSTNAPAMTTTKPAAVLSAPNAATNAVKAK
jgi:TolA-binding protein